MEFLLFVATDPAADPYDAAEDNIEEWVKEGIDRGISIRGDRLRPPQDAKTVMRRNGEVIVSDGPFAETTEWIAGYDIVECSDLDEAIDYASRHPMARFGRIEIRPLWPVESP